MTDTQIVALTLSCITIVALLALGVVTLLAWLHSIEGLSPEEWEE